MKREKVIYLSAFVTALSEGIVTLGIIFYIKDTYNASEGTIGWIGGMWAFFYSIGCIGLKPLFKILTPHKSMILSGILMAIFLILIHQVRDLTLLFILYSLFGLSLSLFWPQAMGWMSLGHEGKVLGNKIGYYNLAWSSGLILSPLISGYLSQLNTSLPLAISALLFLINSVIIFIFTRRESYTEQHNQQQQSDTSNLQDRSTALRYPSWIGLFSTYFVLGIIANIFPIFARETLQISKTTIGLLLLSRSLSTTVTFVLLGRFKFWHFNIKIIILGQLLLLISVILITYARNTAVIGLLMILFGLIFSLNYNLSIFHGASGSTNRAIRMAIHEAILTLGIVSGSIIGGFILQHTSMRIVYLTSAMLTIATLIAQSTIIIYINKHIDHFKPTDNLTP